VIAMEAWSRMTDVAQESILGIIDNYNAKNTINAQVEFVYIAQTQGSQADEKLLTAVAPARRPRSTTPTASPCLSSPSRASSRTSTTSPKLPA
jgi:hypothetical protein